jgi:hypothetical protein
MEDSWDAMVGPILGISSKLSLSKYEPIHKFGKRIADYIRRSADLIFYF